MNQRATNFVPVKRIGLIGTGLVGASWAVVFARAGLPVAAYDANAANRAAAQEFIDRALRALESQKLLQSTVEAIASNVTWHECAEAAFENVDYVQESVGEQLALKREVFQRLDRIVPSDAILASSTSTFPASEFAASLAGCARCVVVHPVNPPHLIPFTEVCGAPFTSSETIDGTMSLMHAVGQSPIHVRQEINGFVLNRLQWTLLAEALRLIADGVATPEDIDRAIRDGLGRRWALMGPFEVGDLNAPNGIGDYLTRFGPAIEKIATSRGASGLPLDAKLIDDLALFGCSAWPEHTRTAREERREQFLLALQRLLSDFRSDT